MKIEIPSKIRKPGFLPLDKAEEVEIEIQYSAKRQRSVSLKYNGQGGFILLAPKSATEDWLQAFVSKRRAWMEKILRANEDRQETRLITPGSTIEHAGFILRIELDKTLEYPKYRVKKSPSAKEACFFLPAAFFVEEKQEMLYRNLEKYMLAQILKEGSRMLLQRAELWATKHKIRVKEFFVKTQKSRLGYCTYDDRIMLNARLLFASQEIQDYVIHHELAHTKHKNHSKAFWAYLEKLFPGAKAIGKSLRNPTLYQMRIQK